MLLACILFGSCSKDSEQEIETADNRTPVVVKMLIGQGQQPATLQAGLFMVNFVDNQPNQLQSSDNYVNNQLLTYVNEEWNTATPIYWNDVETCADFYAYAPYQESVTDARQLAFSIQTDQDVDGALDQSDFLWGTIQVQSPTSESFDLTLAHQLSRLTVTVVAEQGFDDNELQAEDVSVTGHLGAAASAFLQPDTDRLAGKQVHVAKLVPAGSQTSVFADRETEEVEEWFRYRYCWMGHRR